MLDPDRMTPSLLLRVVPILVLVPLIATAAHGLVTDSPTPTPTCPTTSPSDGVTGYHPPTTVLVSPPETAPPVPSPGVGDVVRDLLSPPEVTPTSR